MWLGNIKKSNEPSLTWFSLLIALLPNCWSILGGGKLRGPKIFVDKMSTTSQKIPLWQYPKRFHFVKRQEDAFNCALSLQIPPESEVHKQSWIAQELGFLSASSPTKRRFILQFFAPFYFALFSRWFILHFLAPFDFAFFSCHQNPILSGDRNSGFWFSTSPSFNVVPVKYPELEWPPPKSVIVGIKQIKIDFYSRPDPILLR